MGSRAKPKAAALEFVGIAAAAAVLVWGFWTFLPGEFVLIVGPVLRRLAFLGLTWGGLFLVGRGRS